MKITVYLSVVLVVITMKIATAGSSISDFTLENTDGDLWTLSENTGSGPMIINFWATWCTPCKTELPHLQRLFEKYESEGLQVVSISVDSPKNQHKVKPYVRSRRFTFPVLLDTNGEILRQFQSSNVPFSLIIDSSGRVVETHKGYNPGDEKVIEDKIVELLKAGK